MDYTVVEPSGPSSSFLSMILLWMRKRYRCGLVRRGWDHVVSFRQWHTKRLVTTWHCNREATPEEAPEEAAHGAKAP